jgi:hypothetical protein
MLASNFVSRYPKDFQRYAKIRKKMNADARSLLWNVVGGIVVAILTTVFVYLRFRLRAYQLQRLIGFPFKRDAEIRIIYGQLLLPPIRDAKGNVVSHPYVKPNRRGGPLPLQGTYSIEHPVSECEVRASTYLASLFGLKGILRPIVISDIESDALLDANFVSLGGPGSNYKTADILASSPNIFIRMSHTGFALPSGEQLPYTCTKDADHGFILRVTPPDFPDHSWIVCAGLGEWGTSGAAWYLAHRWKKLARSIHPTAYWSGVRRIGDFLAIVRVVPGRDQSAHIEAIYRTVSGQSKKVK